MLKARSIILLSLFILLLSSFGFADLTTNIIAAVTFDTSYNDSTANNFDITPVNTPTRDNTNCINGKCITFDETQSEYLNWGSVPVGDGTTDVTGSIACWFYFDDVSGSNANQQPFLGKENPPFYAYHLHVDYDHTNKFLNNWVGTGAAHTNLQKTTFTLPTGGWNLYVWSYDETGGTTTLKVWQNKTILVNTSTARDLVAGGDLYLGARPQFGTGYIDGKIDECTIWNKTLTQTDVNNLYEGDGGSPLFYPFSTAPVSNETPTLFHVFGSVNVFNASINGTQYSTTNGTINTPLNLTLVYQLINITASASNYVPLSVYNYNYSTNLTLATFKLVGLEYWNFSGMYDKNNFYYARNLSYTFNYTCWDGSSTQILFLKNGAVNRTISATCTNTTQTFSSSFKPSAEGFINLSFVFNSTYGDRNSTGNTSFLFDLNPPAVHNFTFDFSTGFVNPLGSLNFTCVDSIDVNLTYTSLLNGALLYNKTKDNGTEQRNTSTGLINGDNIANVTCSDLFSSASNETTENIEIRTLYIIDEQKNTGFDEQNVTSLIVYLDDNRTSYDFKANNVNNISFIANTDVKLRFEIIYLDGTIILRYVDIGLLTDDVRVCANTEGITHYEQILTSSETKPVILNSVFSDCVVAADYTRFAYQTAKVLKAYTYNNLYYLYTFENNDITADQVFLASVDGSIATFINLDSLEFLEEGYNINTVGDTLAVEKRNANESEIYYYNVLQDNTALRITIERIENSGTTTVFNSTAFADPNEAQIIFNFDTLSPAVNSTTLFRVTATATDTAGTDSTTIKYFNINGVTGSLSSGMLAIVSIFMLLFGLSFTVAQRTFAWFGLFIVIANIALLTFATAAWYITFLQAVNIIIMIFITLVLVGKNQAQIG